MVVDTAAVVVAGAVVAVHMAAVEVHKVAAVHITADIAAVAGAHMAARTVAAAQLTRRRIDRIPMCSIFHFHKIYTAC